MRVEQETRYARSATPRTYVILACLAVIVALVVDAYWRAADFPLAFDDFNILHPKTGASHLSPEAGVTLRTAAYSTFYWTEWFLGSGAVSWHRVINFVLHLAVAIALVGLYRALCATVLDQARSRASPGTLALVGAALFAAHPVCVYAVVYVAQRSTLMATLFGILMLWSYLEGLRRDSRPHLLAAALMYLIAILCKEHAIMLPAAAVFMTVLCRDHIRASKRSLVAVYLLFAVSAVAVMTLIRGVIGSAYEPSFLFSEAGNSPFSSISGMYHGLDGLDATSGWGVSALTQAGLFFRYLATWLFPNPAWMSIDLRVTIDGHLGTWRQVAGAVAFGVYAIATLLLVLRRGPLGLIGFALGVPAILFATEFSTIRFQEPFVLYRSYLWMLTLPLVALPLVAIAPRLSMAALLPAVLAMTFVMHDRIATFASSISLWSDAIGKYGESAKFGGWRGYYNRGMGQLQAGRVGDAISDFSRAIELAPLRHDLYRARALAFAARGDVTSALRDLDHALEMRPGDANTLAAQCNLKYRLRRTREAFADCTAALVADPRHQSAQQRLMEIKSEREALQQELRSIMARIEHAPNRARDDYLRLARVHDGLESPRAALEALTRGCELGDPLACAEVRARSASSPSPNIAPPNR